MSNRLLRLAAFACAATWLALAGMSGVARAANEDTYCVEVDVSNQITTVYRNADRKIVRQMICSTGIDNFTPLGTFRWKRAVPQPTGRNGITSPNTNAM